MNSKRSSGFTLIEVLVVIAIIAILAAILFPVLGRAQEQGRKTTCMSNMQKLYTAARLFREDNNKWPCMLLGPVETVDGYLWTPASKTPLVPASQVKRSSDLYPAYIKDISTYHCPNNPDKSQTKAVIACFPMSAPAFDFLMQTYKHDWPPLSVSCVKLKPDPDLKLDFSQTATYLYAYDSYDISSALNQEGQRMNTPAGTPGYQIVYSKDWTLATQQEVNKQIEPKNQLKYPNPPLGSTLLTLCNYHVTTGRSDQCPAITASGTAKSIYFRDMVEKGFRVFEER